MDNEGNAVPLKIRRYMLCKHIMQSLLVIALIGGVSMIFILEMNRVQAIAAKNEEALEAITELRTKVDGFQAMAAQNEKAFEAIEAIMLEMKRYLISSLKNTIKGYTVIESSGATCKYIKTLSECEDAARELQSAKGLIDLSAEDDGQTGVSYDPPYCYYESGTLKFNYGGTNTGSCSTTDKCLCHEDI